MKKMIDLCKTAKALSLNFGVIVFLILIGAPGASAQYSGSGTFTQISSLASLTDGYYVIAYTSTKAMNDTNTGSYFGSTAITPSSGTLTNPAAALVWKIQTSGATKTIYNEATSMYVSYTGTSNAAYAVSSVSGNSEKWTVTYSSGNFLFQNAASTTRYLQYNTSAPRFACYTGSQQNLTLYKMNPSTDATLSGLTASAGPLTPSFASGTSSYTISVANAIASTTVTPTVNQANATVQVRVNGGSYTSVTSGSASGALALNVGGNTVDVLVTAQDGTTTQTYTITITRAAAGANTITTTAASFGPYCNGVSNTISVAFTSTGTFTGAYTAQLSDASGSFTSPTNLATTGSSSPLSAIIPSGTAAGTGYRVRVVNATPATVSGNDNGNNITLVSNPGTPACATPAAVCPGTAVTITGAGSSGATSYTYWTSSGGGSAVTTGTTPPGTVASGNLTTPTSLAAGAYTYYVQGENGTCSSLSRQAVTVTINALPSDPSGTITPTANPSCGAATLSYSAPSASIYWETGSGGTSTASPTTSAYSLAATGTIYARAYNGNCWSTGTVNSGSVTVNTAVSITTSPSSASVASGTSKTFTVVASGTVGGYQWQYNDGTGWANLSNGSPYSGVTSASLVINPTALSMSGYQYRCIVSGTAPCTSATSSAATLTVSPAVWEDFETGTKASYATANVTCTAGSWNFNNALIGTSASDFKNGSQSARVNTAGIIAMNFDLTTGLSTVTVSHGMWGSDGATTWRLEASTDGGSTWTAFVSSTYTAPASSSSTQTISVNLTGTVRFRIVNLASSGSNRINFDDIYITDNNCTQPTITSTTPGSTTCGSGTVTLGATASAGTVNWYTASTGGTAIATGNTYSPSISATTTYYVDATSAGCTTSGRTAVVATLVTQPATPACATPAAVCAGSSATITGAGSTGATAYTYWTAATGGTAVTTGTTPAGTVSGNNLSTPTSLTAGSYTYYVQGENGSCISAARQSVTVTVNAVPSNPTGTITPAANPACGSTTLTYSSPSTSLYWETSTSGTSTTSPTTSAYTLSSSGTMYVRAISSGCPSAGYVSSAAITINTNTSITTQPATTYTNVGASASLSVVAAGTGLTYQWQKGGVNITGATSSTYTIASAVLADSGSYRVVVTGTCGSVTSNTVTLYVTNFTYQAGDYRPTLDGTDLSYNNTSGTTSDWEYFDGTSWTTTPGDKGPQNASTRPTRVIITKYVYGGGNATHSYNDIIILNGGTLDLEATATPTVDFIKAGKSLEVQAGGTMFLYGQIQMNASANLIARSGAYVEMGSTDVTNSHVMWNGVENFEPGSELFIADWGFAASGAGSFMNVTTTVTNNSSGKKFGILDFVVTPTSSSWTIIGGGITVNLCDTLWINNRSAGNVIGMTSNTGSPDVTVGRMYVYQGAVALSACYNNPASQTVSITENLHVYSGSTLKLFHNGGGTAGNIKVNLAGNLTIDTLASVINDATTDTGAIFTFSGTSTQLVDVTSAVTAWPMTISSGATVALINHSLTVNSNTGRSTAITVKNGGTLDFGFAADNLTANVIKKVSSGAAGTNTFLTEQNSTLKITSPDGIQQASATLGNVQFSSSNKTFNQLATFWYTGHASQVTGDGLSTSSNGKQIIIDLLNKSLSVTLTQSTGLTNATTISATGGKLDIRKGQFLETATAYITGSTGTLTMAPGTLYQIPALSTGSTDLIPRMDGVSTAYTLNGGTIELAGAGAQTLRGNRTYYNVKFSGSNIYGSDYKNLSTDATINDSLIISGPNTVVNCVDGSAGAVSFSGNGGLIMDAGRIMIKNLNTTQPVLTGTTIPYSLTGGTVEFYGSNATTHQVLRGTDGNGTNINYYNVDINADAANTTDYNVGPAASFVVAGDFNVYSPAVFQLDETENVSGTGNFAVNSGATLKYGSSNGIKTSGTGTADGNIRISGTRSFSSAASYGFVGNGDMVSGNGLPSSIVNLYIQKSGTSDIVTLTNTATATGTIAFTKGRIATGANELVSNNTSGSAITGHGLNKYVIGNLRRYVASSGSYDFPVGNTSYYDLGTINFNSQTGITSLLGYFTTGQSGTAPSTSTCQINGSKINDYLNNGFWTFTPSSSMTGGTYDVTLNAMGYTNAPPAANQMGVIKRSDASSPWLGCGLLNGTAQSGAYGAHSNATQSISGGVATAVRTGVTGFSDFAIGLHQSNTPLPVTLLYLTATPLDDSHIMLDWATASEINNSGFQVERSTDGLNFESIDWVDGSGNSNNTIKYSTDDHQVAIGVIYYYRLKQVDYDGKSQYSNIVSASLSGGRSDITIHNIFPNPASGQVTIDIIAEGEQSVGVAITDMLGRQVLSSQWQLSAGYNDRSYDLTSLADGVYHVTVKAGNNLFTKILAVTK
ncbi:MAG: cadherin-like beta sandwich domain-containing protein [Bacteroidetes bacterium]|nr:cadherin-like beta sandwich domain-containing protein [Bacteroidota bacterium]